jgi:hypothetical protein
VFSEALKANYQPWISDLQTWGKTWETIADKLLDRIGITYGFVWK